MHKNLSLLLLGSALLSGAMWAQGVQNMDIFVAGGPAWNRASSPGGTTNITGSMQTGYGYQVARISAAPLMLDVSFVSAFAQPLPPASPPPAGSVSNFSFIAWTGGFRLMVPVNERLSFYPVAAGGFGTFSSAIQTTGASGLLSSSFNNVGHGVFVFGGGADVRLTRWVSLRAEARDFLTVGGSSEASRNHAATSIGVALHF